MEKTHSQEIACQQVLLGDNSVFSIQWTDLAPELSACLTPEGLLERYLNAVQRMTGGLIRPRNSSDSLSFTLLGRLPLLSFIPPESCSVPEGNGLALRISGGMLVQKAQCDRGELLLLLQRQPNGFLRVTMRLSDYCPMLLGSRSPSITRRWLYRITQAAIHKLVTVRFLGILYRELGGSASSLVTLPVQVREGRET